MQTLQQQWFGNIQADILSGIVVALALIPEAIAFSILAGVDPMVGLYASFTMATVIAIVGGRPAMISAATGAMALVIVDLVADHGLHYLLAATILTGLIQILLGVLGIAKLMRFIPNSVMIGFVNSLAILVFLAQLPHFIGGNGITYVFLIITIGIVYFIPKFFKLIPAPLIAVIILTTAAILLHLDVKTVGDLGAVPTSLPTFLLPNIPLTWETFAIILPYSLALAVVGLLESLLTAQILDDMTDTKSNKNMEARGQGIANIINGFLGGMAGCAMIGQSMINVKSGGRGRLSTLVAGVFLMFLIVALRDIVIAIPMPVLAGIMVMVAVSAFDWGSLKYATTAPKSDVFVMLTTIIIVLYTDNLAIGVVTGIIISALFFVSKISKVNITSTNGTYIIEGPLFFASTKAFIEQLELATEQHVTIDLTSSHLWDESSVGAIVKVVSRLEEKGQTVQIIGMNPASQALYQKLVGLS
ncbi:SulP family inorganic anion transporter [Lysinibacillus piscis]|uniref:Sodium-independent anion transporter n=1 Tax=Lysinibacillus piscis TaxID=2518931 RepID=A0ABQ5NQ99_9BACI|nr:SulP family inorganic anion transporter [Lysinibacillus sp. KH24]GLC90537.1 sodium-independent anion transporter [Lysinibacillus sp. KH24]